ncbi:hypothetical protein Ancab_007437 [Ancistrocladus abbreviatus]
MKDGLEHLPCFKASVLINGISFDSPTMCRSSKEAQNEAARLAFNHFHSPAEPNMPAFVVSTAFSSSPDSKDTEGLKIEDEEKSPNIHSQSPEVGEGDEIQPFFLLTNGAFAICSNSQYKRQLQNNWKKCDAPMFPFKVGNPTRSDDALQHKASAVVNRRSFESSELFDDVKEPELDAAKVALISLSEKGCSLEDRRSYKNRLQELAQREGLSLPTYKTLKSGVPHLPTFYSTVELEGEIFNGKGAKSKKQAEINAAEVAYTALTQGKHDEDDYVSPGSSATAPSEFSSATDCIVPSHSKQTCIPAHEPVSFEVMQCAEKSGENVISEVVSAENSMANVNFCSGDSIPSDAVENLGTMTAAKPFPSLADQQTISPEMGYASSIEDSSEKGSSQMKSWLLCNRVRVYSFIPDIAFPKGITVVPISEDKWAAVSLDFPNEKCH